MILVLCGAIVCSAGFFSSQPDITREQLDEICEKRGGYRSPGRLYVDGYHYPSASPMFGIDQVLNLLGRSRFQYLEMDSAWVKKSYSWYPYKITKIKGNGKYIRFYTTDRGDENCEAFEEFLKKVQRPSKEKLLLRASGIYPNHCVAAIKTNDLKSEYTFHVSRLRDPELPEVNWRSTSVTAIDTGEQYASYNEFAYCFEGKDKKADVKAGWIKLIPADQKLKG